VGHDTLQTLIKSIEGVPIVDLIILGDFFKNDWGRITGWQRGEIFENYSIQFYKNKMEAGDTLEEYLLDPPQLRDIKQSVKRREIVFPIESKFGSFIHTTFRVELDLPKMLAQCRNAT
jgi:hypothetical protein